MRRDRRNLLRPENSADRIRRTETQTEHLILKQMPSGNGTAASRQERKLPDIQRNVALSSLPHNLENGDCATDEPMFLIGLRVMREYTSGGGPAW